MIARIHKAFSRLARQAVLLAAILPLLIGGRALAHRHESAVSPSKCEAGCRLHASDSERTAPIRHEGPLHRCDPHDHCALCLHLVTIAAADCASLPLLIAIAPTATPVPPPADNRPLLTRQHSSAQPRSPPPA